MQRDAADFKPKGDFGVVGNPPYGERLEDAREVHQLYRKIGNEFREFPYYSVYMITSYVEFEKAFGRPTTKRRKLYNGNIEVQFYQYYGLRRKRPQA